MAEQQMQLSQRQQDSSGQWNEAIGLRQASPQPPESVTLIEGQGAADDGTNDAEQVQNPVDAITRLRLDVFAMRLRLAKEDALSSADIKRLRHQQALREAEKMTRRKAVMPQLGQQAHGRSSIADAPSLTVEQIIDQQKQLQLSAMNGGKPNGMMTVAGDPMMQTIMMNNALLQSMLLTNMLQKNSAFGRPATASDAELIQRKEDSAAKRERNLPRRSQRGHHPAPAFSTLITRKIPEFRMRGGPHLRPLVLAIRFLIRCVHNMEGNKPTAEGVLKKDMFFIDGEKAVIQALTKHEDIVVFMQNMKDIAEIDVDFLARKPIFKKATELEVFKLGARLEEIIMAIMKLDLAMIVAGGGVAAGQFLEAVMNRTRTFPAGFLFEFESKLIAEASPSQPDQSRLQRALLISTVILRGMVRGIFLEPLESGLVSDMAESALPTFIRNSKVIGVILYRVMRDALLLSGFNGIMEASPDVIQMVADAKPKDDLATFSDEQMKHVHKKMVLKLDAAPAALKNWLAKLHTDIRLRFE